MFTDSHKMAPLQSAGARLANISELLEQILNDIDLGCGVKICRCKNMYNMRQLLKIQSVSHAFRATILSSPKLRRKLFLSAPSSKVTDTDNEIKTIWNPALWRWSVITPPVARRTHKPDELIVEFRSLSYLHRAGDGAAASWRKMYIRKTRYTVVRIGHNQNQPWGSREVYLVNPTLGDIYDAFF